jgi:hypothetical protein
VYNCLKKDYGIKQEDLILYGQSVGSGPTLHLASRLQKLRGVVLHSAILSGIRVLCPVKMTFWFDIYKVTLALGIILSLVCWILKILYLICTEYRQNTSCQLPCSGYPCKSLSFIILATLSSFFTWFPHNVFSICM